jgi:RND family efflux transporter MFP subunit
MKSSRTLGWWFRRIGVPLLVIGVVAAGWSFLNRGKPVAGAGGTVSAGEKSNSPVAVEVIKPQAGGVQRLVTQPGTVEPFESADLYAKASGFLAEQTVDIGSRVKKGDVLARISVPEYEKQVKRDAARVNDAKAKVKQMEAHLVSAKAEAKAADASVRLAKTLVKAKIAYRQYREKFNNRIKQLVDKEALEAKVADEQEDHYLAALEAENAAKEGVNSAEEKAAAAHSRIDQAEADLEETNADVEVAQADLERSQVLLKYTVIESPYTGVITRRMLHIGDFVKSADQGGNTPLLSVERTDLMRVVVQVPDRDVPYVYKGAPAVVEIDALPGVVFETKANNAVAVARWADAEDPATRTMRTEVDVKNTDGKLRHGMYGRATLILGKGSDGALRVPSAALFGKAEGGAGSIRVVRDGKIRVLPVKYTLDNGVEAEIVSGLNADDHVVVRTTGPVEDGTPATLSNNR